MTDIKKMEFSDETGQVDIEKADGTVVKYNMADVVTASTTSSGEVEFSEIVNPKSVSGLGFEPLRGIEWVELVSTDVVPIASRLADGKIYGQKAGRLYVSLDAARTWAQVGSASLSGGVSPMIILPLASGEALLATNLAVYRTTGWGTSSVIGTLVLTNTDTSQILEWGIDTSDDGQVVVTHYAASDFTKSRYVWYSDDDGRNFRIIRDLTTDGKNDRHIHFAVFDRFGGNRIYIGHHNEDAQSGSGKAIEWTDDKGETWNEVANITITNEAGATRIVQPTTAVSTPRGLILGSDDTWTGLFILPRGRNKIEKLAAGVPQPPSNSVTGFATYSQRDNATGEIYTCWVQSFADNFAYVMASDSVAGAVIYKMPDMYPVSGYGGVGGLPGFVSLAFTASELIVVSRRPSAITPSNNAYWILRANRPARSSRVSSTDGDPLFVEAGSKGTRRGPAVCYASESTGSWTLAIGYGAKAGHPTSCLVIGNNSFATGNRSTLVGNNIITAGANDRVIAIGDDATVSAGGFCVRIGSGGDASGSAISIGYSAVAYAGSVAIGHGAAMPAASADGVVIGRSTTGASYALNIGQATQTMAGGVALGHTASAGNGVAVGYAAKRVSGTETGIVAVGRDSTCSANDTTAVGKSSSAAHSSSVALGAGSVTQRADSISVGARDIESTGPGKGVILQSPDGTKYRITVANGGAISATAV